MAHDNSQSHGKISAWKQSHSSYIKFLRTLKSPERPPSNHENSLRSSASRVQSVTVSLHKGNFEEAKNSVSVVGTSNVCNQRFKIHPSQVKKPPQLFMSGGWTSKINPRNDSNGEVAIRSYNLSKPVRNRGKMKKILPQRRL